MTCHLVMMSTVIQCNCWQALNALIFLDNIKPPIHDAEDELSAMQNGFTSLSKYQLHGTVAAGDDIVFRVIMPANK